MFQILCVLMVKCVNFPPIITNICFRIIALDIATSRSYFSYLPDLKFLQFSFCVCAYVYFLAVSW